MGDSRFRLKVNFSIYGENYECDASLNWTEDPDSGIDRRIVDWFRQSYEDAHDKHLEFIRNLSTEKAK